MDTEWFWNGAKALVWTKDAIIFPPCNSLNKIFQWKCKHGKTPLWRSCYVCWVYHCFLHENSKTNRKTNLYVFFFFCTERPALTHFWTAACFCAAGAVASTYRLCLRSDTTHSFSQCDRKNMGLFFIVTGSRCGVTMGYDSQTKRQTRFMQASVT